MGTQTQAMPGHVVKPVAIVVKAERCLRTRNRFSPCMVCTDTCQREAIRLSPALSLDTQSCTGCGACLATCPAGVFEGDDAVSTLFEAAAQMRGKGVVALACPRHAEPRRAPAFVDGVVCTDRCLAALGPATYVSLLGLGIARIVARLDACPDCPKGAALANIESSLLSVAEILSALQQAERVTALRTAVGAEWQERPLAGTRDERVSRRDFFRFVTGRPGEANAPLPTVQSDDVDQPRLTHVPRERRRLVNALTRLASATAATVVPGATPAFAQLEASDACTACRVCAKVCPTDALKLTMDVRDTFALSFLSAACTGCQECIDMCDFDALHWGTPLPLADVLQMQPVVLRSGTLYSCDRCSTRFASAVEARLCPLCSLRTRNPFGGRIPPSLERRLARQARR
jgi:ferredoxin